MSNALAPFFLLITTFTMAPTGNVAVPGTMTSIPFADLPACVRVATELRSHDFTSANCFATRTPTETGTIKH